MKTIEPFCILVTEENQKDVAIFFWENFPKEVSIYGAAFLINNYYGFISGCLFTHDDSPFAPVLTIDEARQKFSEYPKMMLVSDKKDKFFNNIFLVVEKCKTGYIVKEDDCYHHWLYAKDIPKKTQITPTDLLKKYCELSGNNVDEFEII